LARLDLATHETVSVGVCTNAISSAASDDGLRAYANCASQSISVVDAPSMTVVATVPLPNVPYNVPAQSFAQTPHGIGGLVCEPLVSHVTAVTDGRDCVHRST
jgi:hypothetical protein